MSHDTHVHDVNTSGSVEDSLKLKELSLLVPKLELKIGSFKKELKETKQTFGNVILTLVDRVKSLEVALKRKSNKVILSESEDEETENQGRKIHDIDDDPLVSLVRDFVTPTKTKVSASGEAQEEDISPTTLEAAKTLSKVASQKARSTDKGRRYKRRKMSKGKDIITGLNAEVEVNTGSIKMNTGREKINTAKLEANAELVKDVLGKDMSSEDYAKRMAQQRDYISTFIKNQSTWKLAQLKKLTFEELKTEFEKLVKSIESFVPIGSEERVKRHGIQLEQETSKKQKIAVEDVPEEKGDEPMKKIGKRKKQIARKGIHTDKTAKDEAEEHMEAKKCNPSLGTNIPVNPVPVVIKPPNIENFKIIKLGKKGVYQIVRENGTDKIYISFGAMLKDISSDDLTELYRLVMQRYGINGPEDEYERVFWGDLKTMFDLPLSTDPVWNLPERRYPLPTDVCQAMLEKTLQGDKRDEACYQLLKLIEKQAQNKLP
ncbi:hypothetical protein Tco_1114297 [Tanacetum coccineum]|uniref:Uncharacterized protein n=1 Tax=Tanacetum coccineum TaxID=301880 RepID=A0ABQ5IYD2_9ASTR